MKVGITCEELLASDRDESLWKGALCGFTMWVCWRQKHGTNPVLLSCSSADFNIPVC